MKAWESLAYCPPELADVDTAECQHEANVDGADVPLWRPAEPHCPRKLCEWCCQDTCCACCHAESVLGEEELCPSCLQEAADSLREKMEER